MNAEIGGRLGILRFKRTTIAFTYAAKTASIQVGRDAASSRGRERMGKVSKPTPMRVAREFAKGAWVNMIAERYKVSEAHVESVLMDAMRKLLARRQR